MPPRIPLRVDVHDGVVVAVGVQVQPADRFGVEVRDVVRAQKPARFRVVIAVDEVVQFGLRIEVIPTVAERVELEYVIIIRRIVRDVNTAGGKNAVISLTAVE